MASKTWIGGVTTEVAQVDTFTNSNVGGGAETWTWTLTGENGTTATTTFVDDGSPTTAELYTGLVAAFTAWKHPFKTGITAAGSTPVITLTGTAGTPFYATLTASGTGAYTRAATIACAGKYDWNTAANWVEGVAPIATNHVILTGSNKIIYGLRQAGVAINGFSTSGYSGIIGGPGKPLVIDPDIFTFSGTGVAYIDIGSAAIAATVNATATATAGNAGLYLLGSAITTLTVSSGTVSVAAADGETATITTVQCAGGTVYLGGGLTVTTVHLVSGTVYLYCAATVTTVNADSGVLYTYGTRAITTVNHGSALGGPTGYYSSTGTIGTLNVRAGTADFTKSDIARTVTTANVYNGGALKRNPTYITIGTLAQADASTLTAA